MTSTQSPHTLTAGGSPIGRKSYAGPRSTTLGSTMHSISSAKIRRSLTSLERRKATMYCLQRCWNLATRSISRLKAVDDLKEQGLTIAKFSTAVFPSGNWQARLVTCAVGSERLRNQTTRKPTTCIVCKKKS